MVTRNQSRTSRYPSHSDQIVFKTTDIKKAPSLRTGTRVPFGLKTISIYALGGGLSMGGKISVVLLRN